MKGTKIFILSLKEIVRTFALFLVGILVIIFLIFMFIPKDEVDTQSSKYIPGEYTSSFYLNDSLASVIVTVDEMQILSVSLIPLTETQEVFYPLLEPLMEQLSMQIIEKQSTELEVDVNSIQTSRVLLTAIDKAIEEAKIVQ